MGSWAEFLALCFGALLILVTFGDTYLRSDIGNLDTIFGLTFWKALDAFYFVASIAVFLLYGWVKGRGLHFNSHATLLFVSFVALLVLINLDDFLQVLNLTWEPPKIYWNALMWIYPLFSAFALLLFGMVLRRSNRSH